MDFFDYFSSSFALFKKMYAFIFGALTEEKEKEEEEEEEEEERVFLQVSKDRFHPIRVSNPNISCWFPIYVYIYFQYI